MGATCSADDRRLEEEYGHVHTVLSPCSLRTVQEDQILLELGFSSMVSRLYDVLEVLEEHETGSLCKVRRSDLQLMAPTSSVGRNINGKGIAPSPIKSSHGNVSTRSAGSNNSGNSNGNNGSSSGGDRAYFLKQIIADNPVVFMRWLNTIELLQKLQHPNLPRVIDLHEDEELQQTRNHRVSFLLELCEGPHILERARSYSEHKARKIVRQILEVVQYLHSQDVVHGDLRAEWFRFEHADPKQWDIQLIDFSVARQLNNNNATATKCQQRPLQIVHGDREVHMFSAAPEVLLNGKRPSKRGDMWSVGIILYQLLSGRPPFGDNAQEFMENMRIGNAPPSLEEPEWKRVSSSAKDLIQKLLNLEPNARLTATQALKHGWVKSSILSYHGVGGLSSLSFHG